MEEGTIVEIRNELEDIATSLDLIGEGFTKMRTDIHNLSVSMSEIATSLATIAKLLEKQL